MTATAIISRMVIFLLAIVLALIFGTQALLHVAGLSNRIDNGAPISDELFGPTGDLAAIYNRQALKTERSRIILVGASNLILIPSARLQQALRLRPNSAKYTVNNISVQGIGIQSFRRLVDLSYDGMPASRRGSNIFVIGLYYGFFYRKGGEPLEKAFEKQIVWGGLYSVTPTGEVNSIHDHLFTEGMLFCIRPYILIQRNFQTVSDFGRSLMTFLVTGHAGPLTIDANLRNDVRVTPEQQAAAIRLRTAGLGAVQPVNFAYLEDMARKISAHGDQLVLLDLPLPKWHRDGVHAFKDFRAIQVGEFAKLIAIPGVHYIDLSDSLVDDDFSDSVHPKPLAANHLADLIASRLPLDK